MKKFVECDKCASVRILNRHLHTHTKKTDTNVCPFDWFAINRCNATNWNVHVLIHLYFSTQFKSKQTSNSNCTNIIWLAMEIQVRASINEVSQNEKNRENEVWSEQQKQTNQPTNLVMITKLRSLKIFDRRRQRRQPQKWFCCYFCDNHNIHTLNSW